MFGSRLVFALCLFVLGFPAVSASSAPVAVDGVLDLRHWVPDEQKYAEIDGHWVFYPGVFLSPQGDDDQEGKGIPVTLEKAWAELGLGEGFEQGQGFGTYKLTILAPQSSSLPELQRLAIYLPRHRRDYAMWVNGRHVARSGGPGEQEPKHLVRHRENIIPLPAGSPRYEVIVHASNYLDPFGRTPQPALIGAINTLESQRSMTLLVIHIGLGAGLLFALKYLYLFAFKRRYAVYLWLGLLGLDIALHQTVNSLTYHPELMPFLGEQDLVVRITFFSLIWLIPLYALFARNLYPETHRPWLMSFLIVPALLASAAILFTPISVFSRPLPGWAIYAMLAHIALIVAAVGTFRKKGGSSLLLLVSILFMTALLIHDVLWEQGIITTAEPVMFNLAVALLLLAVLLDQYDIDAFKQVKALSRNLQSQVEERTQDLSKTVSRLQQKEEELTDAYQREEEANRSKTRFLAAASHDLRQPLHAMGLRIDQLRASVNDAAVDNVLGQVESAHSALSDTLSALLDISRIDGEGVEPNPTEFALQDVLNRIADQYSQVASNKGMVLKMRRSRAWLNTDPTLFYRILANLVDNAIKYGASPGVIVGARRRGDAWSVEVWDTGAGIPLDKQGEVFQEFVQLENPTHDRSLGTGLGLSIVQRLCRLMGIGISLASRPSRGTCVKLLVPAGRELLSVESSGHDGQDANARSLRGAAVLLVDDDEVVLAATRDLLASWGCAVIAASSAESAYEEMDGEDIDVIVTDYNLGGGNNALSLIDEVDHISEKKNKAVIVTGEVNPEVAAALRSHTYPVLSKPVASNELRRVLLRLLHG